MVLKKNSKEREVVFVYGTFTLYGCPFQGHLTNETSPKYSPSENPALSIKIRKGWAPDTISLQPLLC